MFAHAPTQVTSKTRVVESVRVTGLDGYMSYVCMYVCDSLARSSVSATAGAGSARAMCPLRNNPPFSERRSSYLDVTG